MLTSGLKKQRNMEQQRVQMLMILKVRLQKVEMDFKDIYILRKNKYKQDSGQSI